MSEIHKRAKQCKASSNRGQVVGVYKRLYKYFGQQHWWPAQTQFEVMVGAILTQNTSWSNVEKAIVNLKVHKLLQAGKIFSLTHKKLASLIRPSGYFNIKAKRLKAFLKFFINGYQASVSKMRAVGLGELRQQLLCVKGIGPETADSILLYALHKPIFVVDAYTKRIFSRHGMIAEGAPYEDAQKFFMQNLKTDVKLFNEYHALLVRLGKEFCRKGKPRCKECPLH
jgi:endonuclease-3 related protein